MPNSIPMGMLDTRYINTSGDTMTGQLTIPADNLITNMKPGADIVVAADDSSDAMKNQADFICDGTADEVTIQAAISALPAGGGKILLCSGTYNLAIVDVPLSIFDYCIQIDRDNVIIAGYGAATILKQVSDASIVYGGIINIDTHNNIIIQNVMLDGGYDASRAGIGIYVKDSSGVIIKDNYFTNITHHNVGFYDASNCLVINNVYNCSASTTSRAIDIDKFDGTGSTYITIAQNTINTNGAHASKCENAQNILYIENTITRVSGSLSGFAIDNSDVNAVDCKEISYISNSFHECGLRLSGRTGHILIAQNVLTNGQIYIDGNSTGGIGMTGGNVDIIGNMLSGSKRWYDLENDSAIKFFKTPGEHNISGNIIENATLYGIELNFNDATCANAHTNIIGNNITGSTNRAIICNKINGSLISNNLLYSNNRGITIDTTSTYNRIMNNMILTTTSDGIQITDSTYNILSSNTIKDIANIGVNESGSSDYNNFRENYFSGNTYNRSVVGANSKWCRNIGVITEASGTATITNTNTYIDITHGLNITPSINNIHITPTNSMGNATKYYISDVGASTFRINADIDPGPTTATFVWQIGSY